jgi:hypothetical protein
MQTTVHMVAGLLHATAIQRLVEGVLHRTFIVRRGKRAAPAQQGQRTEHCRNSQACAQATGHSFAGERLMHARFVIPASARIELDRWPWLPPAQE